MKEVQAQGDLCPKCGGPLTVIRSRSLTGEVLDGRYEIKKPVGRGGMATVYRALHRYLEREVAVKVLRADNSEDAAAIKRFLQEAKVVSQLTSPHTVSIHDFGITDDGHLYLVMEFLEGRSLAEVVAMAEPMDYRRAVDIALQTCESLEEAHAKELWHRDIKPGNIFLTVDEAGREFVKILDFGIAKWGGATETVTRAGVVCGTPEYLSPEQSHGQVVDQRADIYSLGIVLYQMLKGDCPFQARNAVELLLCHRTEKPARFLERFPPVAGIPDKLETIVMWMLRKKPFQRPGTVSELARALRSVLVDPSKPGGDSYDLPAAAYEEHAGTEDLPEIDFDDLSHGSESTFDIDAIFEPGEKPDE